MKYQISLANNARRSLKKIKGAEKNKILVALEALKSEPRLGSKMLGSFEGCYRLRVWPYRIIYEVYNKKLIVLVIAIGQREGIYR